MGGMMNGPAREPASPMKIFLAVLAALIVWSIISEDGAIWRKVRQEAEKVEWSWEVGENP